MQTILHLNYVLNVRVIHPSILNHSPRVWPSDWLEHFAVFSEAREFHTSLRIFAVVWMDPRGPTDSVA